MPLTIDRSTHRRSVDSLLTARPKHRLPHTALASVRFGGLVLCLAVVPTAFAQPAAPTASAEPDTVLARVNGQPIALADVDTVLLLRPIPIGAQADQRRQTLEQLIDELLMGAHLTAVKVQVPAEVIERRLKQLETNFQNRGQDLVEELKKIGSTRNRLRKLMHVSAAWRVHTLRTVTPDQIRTYFQQRQREFDGTQLRVAQILLKARTESQQKEATTQLAAIRQRIEAGELTFSEAVEEYSESPSKKQAGDLGYFAYRGQMPESFTKHVFGVEAGQLSQVFQTQFGVHLCRVTDIKPGQLSLEDVRGEVFLRLTRKLWDLQTQRLRQQASIEYLNASVLQDSPAVTEQN